MEQKFDENPESPDPDLPFLATGQANQVRQLARQAFAENGREVTLHDGYARDIHGNEFGLWNVAAVCHSDQSQPWQTIIGEHVRKLLAHRDQYDLSQLSFGEIQSQVYAKLISVRDMPEPRNGWSYAIEPIPGLIESLVVDFPETVEWLRDREIERLGGVIRLREAALSNLRALPLENRQSMQSRDGATFEVVLGTSVYTASQVLVMPGLLRKVFGSCDLRHGVLAAVAARGQVAMHVINGPSVVPTLHLMARFALAGFLDGVGPLSPNVFWWKNGNWAQLTQLDDSGTVRMMPNDEMHELIRQFRI